MQQQAQHATEFTMCGVPFAYSKLYKSFFCDTKTVLYVLKKHYPERYEETVKKYPELATLVPDMDDAKQVLLDRTWARVEGKMEAGIDANEQQQAKGNEEEKKEKVPQEARPKKKGMISKISKGIKKIVSKFTPERLRKRLITISDDEANESKPNGENAGLDPKQPAK